MIYAPNKLQRRKLKDVLCSAQNEDKLSMGMVGWPSVVFFFFLGWLPIHWVRIQRLDSQLTANELENGKQTFSLLIRQGGRACLRVCKREKPETKPNETSYWKRFDRCRRHNFAWLRFLIPNSFAQHFVCRVFQHGLSFSQLFAGEGGRGQGRHFNAEWQTIDAPTWYTCNPHTCTFASFMLFPSSTAPTAFSHFPLAFGRFYWGLLPFAFIKCNLRIPDIEH